ncbi:hypothetical protein NIES4071_89910 [Calothrix sp. NIES-4071]|nr:hypothetical protein NIES4071_89910 [Calothrix sp. NIES-4071]BAZ63258.1 hypothetical protein NIES4105_89840 [Calothrix sp. NIES-4105]
MKSLINIESILKSLKLDSFCTSDDTVISKSPKSEISLLDEQTNQTNSKVFFDTTIVDQTYRLSKECENKNVKLIISIERLFWTKFDRIIINEYYYSLKQNGYLILIISPEFKDSAYYLKDLLFKEYKGSFEFVSCTNLNGCDVVCFRKTDIPRVAESDIKKWTFGFIGNGKKDKFIDEQIKRIQKLPLKDWEVIICGTYNLPLEDEKVKYINFTENDDKGWITKKKNLIAQAATYENLVILHDRYIIPDDFVEKMEEWGNDFELLGAKQVLYRSPLRIDQVRIQDWMMSPYGVQVDKETKWKFQFFFLEYTDWDILAYIVGGLYIVKKSLMLKIPQNEELFWYFPEDLTFSQDFSTNGYCVRINTKLKFETVSFAHEVEFVPHRIVSDKRYLGNIKTDINPSYIYERFVEKLMPKYMESKYEIETKGALKLLFGDNIPSYILEANPISTIRSENDLIIWYYQLMTIDYVRLMFCQMSAEQKIQTLHKIILRRRITDTYLLSNMVTAFKESHLYDERAVIKSFLEDTGELQRRIRNLTVPNYPFDTVKNMLHIRLALLCKPIAIFLIKTLYQKQRLYRIIASTARFFFKSFMWFTPYKINSYTSKQS